MSIASEKIKFASERFLLVRLNPARYILPVLNGAVYEITLPFVVNKIERNGVELTQDVVTPSTNDFWYQDETTGLLQVKLAGAPNDTTNVLIAYHYLFYTGTVFRSISEDPENTSTTTREWQPRITNYPTILQSFDNIVAGFMTISDTAIELINEDGTFQENLTDEDTFYNKAVDIWLCINSASNIQKIFTGTVRSLALSQNKVQINVTDSFNKLKQPAFMGDTASEAYFRRDADSFPDLDPKHSEKPCPFILGASSRYQTEGISAAISGMTPYQLSLGTEAFCTSYDSSVSTTTNRTWGTCRIKGSLTVETFTTAQATTTSGAYRFIRFATITGVEVGDTFRWTNAGTPYYARVCHVGTFTHSAVNYNLVIESADPYLITDTLSSARSFGVFIKRGTTTYYPLQVRDYTLNEVTTSHGNTFTEIVFTSSLEANLSISPDLNTSTDQVYYRASNDDVQAQDEALLDLVTLSGLTPNTASFTAANALLPVNVRFHIPNFDETTYKDYLEYVQDILKSTIGYLKINSDFEVEYHILEAPTSTEVRDNSLVLDSATSCAVEYQDIVTQIIAFNPHHDSVQALEASATPSVTRETTKARWLHGFENVDRFRHVLEDMSTKIDDHINLKSMRRAVYRFSTATEDIDTELGDDLELTNKIILGLSDAQDVKVITIEKSPGRINLEAQDLKGL